MAKTAPATVTDKTVVSDEEFQQLVETAHGNGGLFEPDEADAWVLLMHLLINADMSQRETYQLAVERLVMPYSSHFGNERARSAALSELRGVELKSKAARRKGGAGK